MNVNRKKSEELHSKHLAVNLTPSQFEKIKKTIANSTCRSLTQYFRKVLFHDPIAVYYRNQSFDEFMDVMIIWRKEIKAIMEKQAFTEEDAACLIQLMKQIQEGINKIFDLCSLK